jgi:hypothetical protein
MDMTNAIIIGIGGNILAVILYLIYVYKYEKAVKCDSEE